MNRECFARAWWSLAMGIAIWSVAGCGPSPQTTAPSDATAPPVVSEEPDEGAPSAAASPEDVHEELDEFQRLYEEAAGKEALLRDIHPRLEVLVADHPDLVAAMELLTQVRLELGDIDGSLALAERCVEVSSESSACWLTIGVLQETRGNAEAAVEAYRAYLSLMPDGRYAKDAARGLKRLGSEPP